jgi:3-deoxy-manno-octulosonate cytidylyltransferase (CMP-KDO synthetase)
MGCREMAGEVDISGGTVIIVPARLESTRLPRKPLADIAGLPLIIRVMEGLEGAPACLSAVATDSHEIATVVRDAGYRAVVTGPARNGTERVYLAWLDLGKPGSRIINVQGDEPAVEPGWIRALVEQPPSPDLVVTLARRGTSHEAVSPDAVKVVTGSSGEAISFSRRPVPDGTDTFFIHVGVYCFSPESLETCISGGATEESRSESLEQLAWLQNGIRIRVVSGEFQGCGVDTPEDLERVREVYGQR